MNKKKINLFDLLSLVLIGLFAILFLFAIIRPPKDLGGETVMRVRVDQGVEVISPEVRGGDTVFVNGINVPSKIVSSDTENGVFFIDIKGLGKNDGELIRFNGQRVLVGQKVELRGRFWAQGVVTNLELK